MQTDESAARTPASRDRFVGWPRSLISVALVAACCAAGCARPTDFDGEPAPNPSPSSESPSSNTDVEDAGRRTTPAGGASADAGGAGSVTKPATGSVKTDAGKATAAAGSNDAGGAGASDPSIGDGDPEPGDKTEDGDDPCGADAQLVTGPTRTMGSADTYLQTSGDVEILGVHTVLTVPSKPAPTRGTLFVWPGLQPLRSDSRVGYGVLQPVLTWGPSCAPGSLTTYDQWWISAQYVGSPPGSFMNVMCEGGDVMRVEVGDELDIELTLEGTSWNQRVTNKSNGKSVSFKRDMNGQKQQWLINEIEVTGQTRPVDDVIFTSLVVKLSDSQPRSCVPTVKGMSDYFSPPRASSDGKTCCIDKLILRASGIRPSSPDTP